MFTVPEPAQGLIEPRERLDLFVERVIRMATSEVLLGGPFWNDPGIQRLLNVLAPAITERGVACAFYVHAWPDAAARDRLGALIGAVGAPPQVRTWWYQGPARSLMHAKFVADCREGYLGTANLSSQGPEQHVEIGAAWAPASASNCAGCWARSPRQACSSPTPRRRALAHLIPLPGGRLPRVHWPACALKRTQDALEVHEWVVWQ
ncbi:hypothetical protein ER308_08730 [Egibacter rhizosphaerae]|uniref:Phospholipase D-like domain-containing protein n=1 Tax=Egibacter rhizosphaerae TaxID=1670831 RepID=A0A411YEV6_9ACTN|nr:hypothetical protein [Egibacter rhizosphaerae]QBI19627.1 hypothetical protein ER308_08730 [Egibacter rhizosphaerae]